MRKPFSDSPKRAPLTGTSFDFIRIGVPCARCGMEDKQLVAELVANDTTICGYCRATIDLTTDHWRARLAEAEGYKEITFR